MHNHWMQRCLDLAKRGAGSVSPNPMVGAVIVGQDGVVLGEGHHAHFGGPHAEVKAIRNAEDRGFADRFAAATLYVNLEPCSHHGKTPPCADVILEKQIPRVVVAIEDPNPQVAGRGLARLREAGVEVTVGIMERAAKRLNEAFGQHVTTGKPLVTLKIAQTLEGKIAADDGAPLTITSLESRTLVHRWRSELDAVLIGSGTALADDPQLTVRHCEGRQPMRVVLDRLGVLPSATRLFSDEYASKTVVVVSENAIPAYADRLMANGGRLLRATEREGHLDLTEILRTLGAGVDLERPIQSVLVEAGPRLSAALLQQNLVDRLFVFTASRILGQGTARFETSVFEDPLSFAEATWEQVGPDVLFRGYRRVV